MLRILEVPAKRFHDYEMYDKLCFWQKYVAMSPPIFFPSSTSRDRKYSLDLQYVQLLNKDLYIMENTQYYRIQAIIKNIRIY